MNNSAGEAVVELVREQNDPDKTFARMFRKITREMAPHVNDLDFRILMFIFDRTYSYGKTAEVIPTKHFLEGVYTGDGSLLHPRIHTSRTALYRGIQRLIDNVIILRTHTHHNSAPRYAINPVWEPLVSHQRDTGVPSAGYHRPKAGTHNKRLLTCDTQQVAPAYAGRNGLEEEMQTAKDRVMAAVAGATERNHASRDKRKAKLNATGLEKIWEDAYREAYPDETYFKWRVFEQSAFARAVKRGVPLSQVEAFIGFCVASFDNVINTRFRWMKSKPSCEVGFVTKHIAEFFKAFEEDRDPNRKIKRVIRDSQKEKPNGTDKQADPATEAELERLRTENAALKAKVGDEAVKRHQRRKLTIRNRPRTSPEFGSWED